MIPVKFAERMKQMLGEAEFSLFIESYEKEKYQALRINPLKGQRESFLQRTTFCLNPVPWEPNGFYYQKEDYPGKHPFHDAGVYYIQEPSAMAPATYLDVVPGQRVLDLCAAPGGKSTQIAAAMQGEGLLISNEIHPARAKILSENMERMGVTNSVVVNETPENLRKAFGCFFHRIMVDAPCSGEGMFRKQEEAAQEWSPENVTLCASRQDNILEQAYEMLLPGGRMVYSTCTFAPEENEGSMTRFLEKYSDMELVEVHRYDGMEEGQVQWYENATPQISRTIRLWPHKLQGEGHFVAVLQKSGEMPEIEYKKEKTHSYKEFKDLDSFVKQTLTEDQSLQQGGFLTFGEQLYLAPKELPKLKGIKVLRPGLHLGTLKKNRFEPSHAWALALKKEEVKHTCALSLEDPRVMKYLKGETIEAQGEKGWQLVTVDDYSLGWGKLVGQVLKNHYPKGLRN